MIRGWIGVGLLAGSWLLGLDYYHPAGRLAWVVLVVLGTLLLISRAEGVFAKSAGQDRRTGGGEAAKAAGRRQSRAVLPGGVLGRLPSAQQIGIALVLLLPAVCLLGWPYKAAPLWIVSGLVLHLAPVPRRWPKPLGRSAVAGGAILLVQSLGMSAYECWTARSHDLPGPLAWLTWLVVRLLGVEAARDGSTLAIRSAGQVHRLGATWGLLLDPVTLGFLLGGAAMLGLIAWSSLPAGRRRRSWFSAACVLAATTVVWLPFRSGLLVAIYLDRGLAVQAATPPTAMNQFASPWVHLLMLAGPVLLAWRFVRLPRADQLEGTAGEDRLPLPGPGLRRALAASGLVLLAAAVFAGVFQWEPVGTPKAGRVMVVERHSEWESTERAYDTEEYGELASYNYRMIYEYCDQYFEMSRLGESEPIDERTLGRCDVLLIKIPTARYTREEVDAVERFVHSGGGLLLVGDHTNVFKSSTYLNDIARRFGFTFRNDLLFCIGSPYDQAYRRPLVPHPLLGGVPRMNFVVSCSIDPGRSLGSAVIRSTGLWSLPPTYHTENYHPEAEYRPEMRYGAFVQLWAARCGSGRVLAFTDSTAFSNFCTFQPGKAELMLGMLGWLNHRSPLDNHWLWLAVAVPLVVVAGGLLAAGFRLAPADDGLWLALLAAAVLGWTAGSTALAAAHRHAMPPPAAVRPMLHVVVDRTVSEVPLSLGAFTQGDGEGYGLLEQWIARVGCFTSRRSGPEAFAGDALLVLCPTRSVSPQLRRRLIRYVEAGGKLLVVDSPEVEGSTANSLLWPFGLAIERAEFPQGKLMLSDDWPQIPLAAACRISGGQSLEPLAWVGEDCVAARVAYGRGSVMAIGFGGLFNDANMGSNWMTEPDADMLTQYDVLFSLVRALLSGEVVDEPPRRQ